MKKIENIQVLRGIAAILVVLLHISKTELKYGGGERILGDFFEFGNAGVDLFFLISGFVMVMVTRGQFANFQHVKVFLYNRITRIYPPYWFYSFLVLVVWLVKPGLMNASVREGTESIIYVVKSFLLLPQESLPLLILGWTLVHEMYFYLVFSALLLFREKHLVKLLCCWALLIGAYWMLRFNLVLPPPNPWIKLIFSPLTMEFITGALLAKLVFAGKTSHGWAALCIGVSTLLVGWAVFGSGFNNRVPLGWSRVLLFGLPSAFILYGAVVLELKSKFRFPQFMQIMGDASYSIYLSHLLVLGLLGRMWQQLATIGLMDNIIATLTMLAVALAAGVLGFQMMERPVINWARKGRRKLENSYQVATS